MSKYITNKSYTDRGRITHHLNVFSSTAPVQQILNRGFEYEFNNNRFVSIIEIKNHKLEIVLHVFKNMHHDPEDYNKQKMCIEYSYGIYGENWNRNATTISNLNSVFVTIDQFIKEAHSELYDHENLDPPKLEIEETMLSKISDMI